MKHPADMEFRPSPFNAPTVAVHGHFACRGTQRRKVCIYGAGLGREQAPLFDPDWEVWAINLVVPYTRESVEGEAQPRLVLRADRWFDLHQRRAQTADDLRWIANCPVPIYVPPDLLDAGPNCVRFPLPEIERLFGVSYWTCTFAYQIALAMWEGVATDIGLYGVELAFGTERERSVEWACTAYWMGRAAERGIRIHVPEPSTLGRHCARYGFEYDAEKDEVERYVQRMRETDRHRMDQKGMGG